MISYEALTLLIAVFTLLFVAPRFWGGRSSRGRH